MKDFKYVLFGAGASFLYFYVWKGYLHNELTKNVETEFNACGSECNCKNCN